MSDSLKYRDLGIDPSAVALCVCSEQWIEAHVSLFVSVHAHECMLTAEEW